MHIHRNCNALSGRHHYIKELMKYIDVDSFGSCLHTKDMPKDVPGRYDNNDLSYLTTLIKDYKVRSLTLVAIFPKAARWSLIDP